MVSLHASSNPNKMTANLSAQFINYFIIQPDLILFLQGHMLQKLELLA